MITLLPLERWSEQAALIDQLMVQMCEAPDVEVIRKLSMATGSVLALRREEDHAAIVRVICHRWS